MMKRTLCGWLAISVIPWLLVAFGICMPIRAEDQIPKPVDDLATIGQPGPKAIQLFVRTDKPADHVFKPGESISLYVKVEEKCHLMAVYLSATGDAIVLFPNSCTPDSELLPQKDHTLFSDAGPLKLKVGDSIRQGRIILFVSSKPFSLEPLNMPLGRPCVQISSYSRSQFEALKQKIEVMAQDEGFNRVGLTLIGNGDANLLLDLMGLPKKIKSEKPESLVGSQGVRSDSIDK